MRCPLIVRLSLRKYYERFLQRGRGSLVKLVGMIGFEPTKPLGASFTDWYDTRRRRIPIWWTVSGLNRPDFPLARRVDTPCISMAHKLRFCRCDEHPFVRIQNGRFRRVSFYLVLT